MTSSKYPYVSINDRPPARAPSAPHNGIEEYPPPYNEAVYSEAVLTEDGLQGRPMAGRGDALGRLSFEQRLSLLKPTHSQRWHFRFALLQLFLAVLTLGSAAVCVKFSIPAVFMPHYTGCWAGALGVVAACVAITAAIRDSNNGSVAAVAWHVIAAIGAGILGSLALNNAVLIGQTPESRAALPCLLPSYEPTHIKWIYENASKLRMANCLNELKFGFMAMTSLMVMGCLQVLTSFICLMLVLHRLCSCAKTTGGGCCAGGPA